MTKRVMLCVLLMSGLAGAQTVYEVPGNSKGNTIVLTVANESATEGMRNVVLEVTRIPRHATFAQKGSLLKVLGPGTEADCGFTFDVARAVKPGERDTVEFSLREQGGPVWKKALIFAYVGPKEYRLEQNFPNPFNPATTIYYDLPWQSRVSIVLYDILGRRVRTFVDEAQEAGYHDLRFDGATLATGAYIYRMTAEPMSGGKTFTAVKKLMLLK